MTWAPASTVRAGAEGGEMKVSRLARALAGLGRRRPRSLREAGLPPGRQSRAARSRLAASSLRRGPRSAALADAPGRGPTAPGPPARAPSGALAPPPPPPQAPLRLLGSPGAAPPQPPARGGDSRSAPRRVHLGLRAPGGRQAGAVLRERARERRSSRCCCLRPRRLGPRRRPARSSSRLRPSRRGRGRGSEGPAGPPGAEGLPPAGLAFPCRPGPARASAAQ